MFVFFAKGPKNYLYMMFSFFFVFPISPFSFVTWSCHPLFCVFSYELFLRMTSISWGVGVGGLEFVFLGIFKGGMIDLSCRDKDQNFVPS